MLSIHEQALLWSNEFDRMDSFWLERVSLRESRYLVSTQNSHR